MNFQSDLKSPDVNEKLFASRNPLVFKNSIGPTARILVLYIRLDQEAIFDSISFAVQGQLQIDIGVSFSHSTFEPGAKDNKRYK